MATLSRMDEKITGQDPISGIAGSTDRPDANKLRLSGIGQLETTTNLGAGFGLWRPLSDLFQMHCPRLFRFHRKSGKDPDSLTS